MLENSNFSKLNVNQMQSIQGGTVNSTNYPDLDDGSDHCPSAINPDGTFNKDSGWCGSGPGGSGVNPMG
ncbi:hypothetical protein NBT05_05760 [Aquimarina sp. ERC-38]|uniref:hypothetical protein n=1 Tax=Aquimarina sp. ERC-38 TaxID=2949996 RepID=UPI00224537FB|nr:hypothetical protein [Aquimarina sp. ERC-38]UZO81971.1 hypothetical protein NBT05_05760 [Aquimarina sp. ERC-38]